MLDGILGGLVKKILAILFICLFCTTAHAQLFSDGFESGDCSAWDDSGTGGSASIDCGDTSPVFQGTYSANFQTTGTFSESYVSDTISETTAVIRAYVYIPTTALSSTIDIMAFFGATEDDSLIVLQVNADEEWQYYNIITDTATDTNVGIEMDEWMYVEFESTLADSGTVKLNVNGTSVVDSTEDTKGSDSAWVTAAVGITFSGGESGTVNVNMDNMVVNNAAVGPQIPIPYDIGSIDVDVGGAASTTPNCPTHQADDILFVVAVNAGGNTMSTASTGWTEIDEVDGTDNIAWYWKRATSTTGEDPEITASGTDQFAICWVIYGAATSVTPYEDATTAGDGTTAETTPDTAEITTTGDNRLVMNFFGISDDSGFSSGHPPSGWSPGGEVSTSSGTDARIGAMLRTEFSATTVSSAVIGTLSASELWGSLTLGFFTEADKPSAATIEYIQLIN
jgi:hypothetical protein